MAESDSDLEIIDEVPIQNSKSPSYFTGLQADSDNELLDLDEIDVNSKGSKSKYRKSRKNEDLRKNSGSKSCMSSVHKKNVPEIVLSDSDDNGNDSEATEVVGDDDVDSLPSISPPPLQVDNSPTYDNENHCMDYDGDGFGGSHPAYQSSGRTTQTSSSKSSLVSSSRDSQDIDDLFQELEYESLTDYLAKIDTKKKTPTLPNKSSTSTSNNATTSKVMATPVLTTFAHQSVHTTSGVGNGNSESRQGFKKSISLDKPVRSYQVNRKSPTKRKSIKRKAREIPVATASSSTTSLSSIEPAATGAQGPNRQKQPKDVLKMIILQVAENVLSDELAAKIIEKEIQFKIADNPAVGDSIFFEHNIPYKMVQKDQQVHEKVLKEIDANVVIIFPIEQHLELLQGELDRFDSPASAERLQSLTEWIQEIRRKKSDIKLTLLVQGLETYLRKIQRATQREYRDRVLNVDNPENSKKKRKAKSKQGIKLSRYEVQNAFISTSLETQINYRFYENSSDLVLLLQQYAKSIGEAPYKKEKMKSTDFDWYAVADAVGGIPVEDNGQGMRSLWLAQLQQFPKVGQESALAIARMYGSPKELFQAYRRCSSVEEGKNLLTNVQVTMGVGPLAKTRRLGPEASKKVYRFFTSTDGEREIDC